MAYDIIYENDALKPSFEVRRFFIYGKYKSRVY